MASPVFGPEAVWGKGQREFCKNTHLSVEAVGVSHCLGSSLSAAAQTP